MDTEWECIECGYVFEGEKPPRQCPDCKALDSFEQIEYGEEWEGEEDAAPPSEPEWECLECSHVFEGEKPPRQCPDCKALDSFEQIEYVEDWTEEKKDAGQSSEREWECLECGHVIQGEKPPGECPECKALDSWAEIVYDEEWEEGEAAAQPSESEWECLECGHVFEGDKPPAQCPDCEALDSFAQIEYVEEWEEVEADVKGNEEAIATGWECSECGYFVNSERPPQRCPDCDAESAWLEVEYYADWDEEETDSDEQAAEVDSDAT